MRDGDEAPSDRLRKGVGLLFWLATMAGGVLLHLSINAKVFSGRAPPKLVDAVATGAVYAALPLAVYFIVPWLLDRFDPEPWWFLFGTFLWGAVVATGVASWIGENINLAKTLMLRGQSALVFDHCVKTPIVEEALEGAALLGIFHFLRRERGGVVDAVIYAIFVALGFAAVENVLHYARGALAHKLDASFYTRGVLTPWVHPLFTSMTAVGIGLARESTRVSTKLFAPIAGFFLGAALHGAWNYMWIRLGKGYVEILPLWFGFLGLFVVVIVALSIRKGRIIREHLGDEVRFGTLTASEVELVTSAFGRLRCTLSWRGATGRDFIHAASRLALSKWHAARARRGGTHTVSYDFIGPLRAETAELAAELRERDPRARRR